ncbi:MAG: hypothetical protein PQJ59_01680 [Spirochaetales bacterium]|nr:hypothetical protein [Spirochaetales bacterium]
MSESDQILTTLREMKAQMYVLTTAVLGGIPEWVTIQKACELKGMNLSTVTGDKRLQPRFGVPDKRESTRKYWKRDTIIEWLGVVGEGDRLEYAQRWPTEYRMINCT